MKPVTLALIAILAAGSAAAMSSKGTFTSADISAPGELRISKNNDSR